MVVPVLETLRTSRAYTCAKGVQPSRRELPRWLRSHAPEAPPREQSRTPVDRWLIAGVCWLFAAKHAVQTLM